MQTLMHSSLPLIVSSEIQQIMIFSP